MIAESDNLVSFFLFLFVWSDVAYGLVQHKYTRYRFFQEITMTTYHRWCISVAQARLLINGKSFSLKTISTTRCTDYHFEFVSSCLTNNSYWIKLWSLMKGTESRINDPLPDRVESSNCKLNSFILSILHKVSLIFSAIWTAFHWIGFSQEQHVK